MSKENNNKKNNKHQQKKKNSSKFKTVKYKKTDTKSAKKDLTVNKSDKNNQSDTKPDKNGSTDHKSEEKEHVFRDAFKEEYNKDKKAYELKKKHTIPLAKWKKILITVGILVGVGGASYVGRTVYLENTEHIHGIGLSDKQQKSFINGIRKLVKSGWRPNEINDQVSKKYKNFNSRNQQELAYLVYRSQQNTSLYYNSYLYFMQADFAYYGAGASKNPLYPKVASQNIPATLNDIRNNHESIEYVGNDAYQVLPDFKWTEDTYHPTGDFGSFLKIASVENENPIFKNKKQNIPETYNRLINILNWANNHKNSEFYQDAVSLAKFYYLALFQINNGLNIQQSAKSARVTPNAMKQLKKYDNKDNPFYKDFHAFMKDLDKHNGKMTSTMIAEYQTIANNYFGDSIFDSYENSVGGAPKQNNSTPDTMLGDGSTNKDNGGGSQGK